MPISQIPLSQDTHFSLTQHNNSFSSPKIVMTERRVCPIKTLFSQLNIGETFETTATSPQKHLPDSLKYIFLLLKEFSK
jgi:hypothetical protein